MNTLNVYYGSIKIQAIIAEIISVFTGSYIFLNDTDRNSNHGGDSSDKSKMSISCNATLPIELG
ncbi:hypothetical protein SUGI_0673210 [Cryptomeria japonica]|nr:hypothetical protein SUGI_0673210 [Cryptomeria japonica]